MSTNHSIHVGRTGYEALADGLTGSERIYAGIRPYGYHAGNRIVLAVYPHLLARAVAARGVEPAFDYVITLNDLEPRGYDFAGLQPVGRVAGDEEIRVTIDRLESDLVHLRNEFPRLTVRVLPSSEIVGTELFAACAGILRDPAALEMFLTDELRSLLSFEGGEFFGIACAACGTATRRRSGEVCSACGETLECRSSGRAYWMFYVPLIAMKLAHVRPDVALLGGDYLDTADHLAEFMRHANMLEAIWGFYDLISERPLTLLCPPILLGTDGRKMGKSLGNISEHTYDEVMTACATTAGDTIAIGPAPASAPTRSFLDPVMRSLAEERREVSLRIQDESPEGILRLRRFQPNPIAVPDPDDAVTVVRMVPGPGGLLELRAHRPTSDPSGASVLFAHGGGWVWGCPESFDTFCRHVTATLGCQVFCSSYRFAPEHPYPAALDDYVTVFRWIVEHADELGIDPGRVVVGGCSAGANLAAATALRARDEEWGIVPAGQLLYYPVLDRPFSHASYFEDLGVVDLDAEEMQWYVEQYVGDADSSDPYVFPLRAETLSGLPPALVVAAGYDPLRDEARAYADRLVRAGVEATHLCYDSLGHAFLSCVRVVPEARRALAESLEVLARLLDTDPVFPS